MASNVVRITYYPVGGNRDFLMARDREILCEGPAGSGKSLSMMNKVHLAALKYPGARILLFRKTLEALKTGALKTYREGVRPDLDGVKPYGGNTFSPAEYRYPNGSVVIPGGIDKIDKFMSSEFDIIAGNEITDQGGISESDWQKLTTRLRNNKMPYQQIIADCNPSYAKHWANQRCNRGRMRRIKTTHKDNPAYWRHGNWTDIGQEYVKNVLGELTGVVRKRLLDGVWASADGLVYDDFDPESMVKERNTSGWRTVLGVDIGGVNPTVVLVARISPLDEIHIERCVYRPNLRSADAITQTVVSEANDVGPDNIYVDPSAAPYIGDIEKAGFPVMAAENKIQDGISRVQSVMKSGRLTIDPSCTELVDELGEYAYPENPKPGNENPVKKDDHCVDAMRYLICGIVEPVFDLAAFYGGVNYA